ncbi:MAG: disulfide bond formation protein DsbA [Actinomycetota bacterium]
MTARWVVDEIRPHRDLNITWQPISLLVKNNPAEDSDYYAPVAFTHKLLRVQEAIRAAEGDDAVERIYWHFATLIHHDKNRDFDVADELEAAGFDRSYATAMDDESLEDEVRSRMQAGLELTGNDVGTPIIALDDDNGDRVALFGPVITKVPTTEQSLRLWDGFVACAQTPGFWELKRTRTQSPEFGERPS